MKNLHKLRLLVLILHSCLMSIAYSSPPITLMEAISAGKTVGEMSGPSLNMSGADISGIQLFYSYSGLMVNLSGAAFDSKIYFSGKTVSIIRDGLSNPSKLDFEAEIYADKFTVNGVEVAPMGPPLTEADIMAINKAKDVKNGRKTEETPQQERVEHQSEELDSQSSEDSSTSDGTIDTISITNSTEFFERIRANPTGNFVLKDNIKIPLEEFQNLSLHSSNFNGFLDFNGFSLKLPISEITYDKIFLRYRDNAALQRKGAELGGNAIFHKMVNHPNFSDEIVMSLLFGRGKDIEYNNINFDLDYESEIALTLDGSIFSVSNLDDFNLDSIRKLSYGFVDKTQQHAPAAADESLNVTSISNSTEFFEKIKANPNGHFILRDNINIKLDEFKSLSLHSAKFSGLLDFNGFTLYFPINGTSLAPGDIVLNYHDMTALQNREIELGLYSIHQKFFENNKNKVIIYLVSLFGLDIKFDNFKKISIEANRGGVYLTLKNSIFSISDLDEFSISHINRFSGGFVNI